MAKQKPLPEAEWVSKWDRRNWLKAAAASTFLPFIRPEHIVQGKIVEPVEEEDSDEESSSDTSSLSYVSSCSCTGACLREGVCPAVKACYPNWPKKTK